MKFLLKNAFTKEEEIITVNTLEELKELYITEDCPLMVSFFEDDLNEILLYNDYIE